MLGDVWGEELGEVLAVVWERREEDFEGEDKEGEKNGSFEDASVGLNGGDVECEGVEGEV